jgi:hypothetical protein
MYKISSETHICYQLYSSYQGSHYAQIRRRSNFFFRELIGDRDKWGEFCEKLMA